MITQFVKINLNTMSWCFFRDQIKGFFYSSRFPEFSLQIFIWFTFSTVEKKYCRICVCQMISKVIYKVLTPRFFQFWFYYQKQSKFNALKRFHSRTKDPLFVFENEISWLLRNLIIPVSVDLRVNRISAI